MGMFDDLMPGAPAGPGMFDDLPKPKPAGMLRKLADKGLGFASGAVGATKAIADATGAGNRVSGALGTANEFLNDNLSAEAKADQQQQSAILDAAKGQGAWEGVKAGARAFGVAPVQTAVQGLGSIVPIIAGTALTGGAAPAAAVGAGIGAAMGLGTAKGAIYDEIKKRGGTDAEATKAQEYGGANTDQIALGGALGTADALTGVSGIAGGMIRRAVGKPVADSVASTALNAIGKKPVERGIIGRAGMGMLGEMPLEAAQGGQEQLAANIAAQRAGYQAGTWDNVASNATLEALASAGPGAVFGAMDRQSPATQPPQAQTGTPPANPRQTPGASPAQPGTLPENQPPVNPITGQTQPSVSQVTPGVPLSKFETNAKGEFPDGPSPGSDAPKRWKTQGVYRDGVPALGDRIREAYYSGNIELAQSLADQLPDPQDDWEYRYFDGVRLASSVVGGVGHLRDLTVRGMPLELWQNDVSAYKSTAPKRNKQPPTETASAPVAPAAPVVDNVFEQARKQFKENKVQELISQGFSEDEARQIADGKAVSRPAPTPAQQAGIDANAGPLSAAAATAVNAGITPITQSPVAQPPSKQDNIKRIQEANGATTPTQPLTDASTLLPSNQPGASVGATTSPVMAGGDQAAQQASQTSAFGATQPDSGTNQPELGTNMLGANISQVGDKPQGNRQAVDADQVQADVSQSQAPQMPQAEVGQSSTPQAQGLDNAGQKTEVLGQGKSSVNDTPTAKAEQAPVATDGVAQPETPPAIHHEWKRIDSLTRGLSAAKADAAFLNKNEQYYEYRVVPTDTGYVIESRPKKKNTPTAPTIAPPGVTQQPAQPTDGFDSKAWNKKRDDTIKESRKSGAKHLDSVTPSVESMRGREIYNVHDPKEKGVIRTVDNNGNVYVQWSDDYSGKKNSASETEEPNKSWLKTTKSRPIWKKKDGARTLVLQTSLGTTDLKDYVFGTGEVAQPAQPVTGQGAGVSQPTQDVQWDSMTPDAKTDVLKRAGWRTNAGGLNVVGKNLLKKKWADIVEGTQATITKNIKPQQQGNTNGTQTSQTEPIQAEQPEAPEASVGIATHTKPQQYVLDLNKAVPLKAPDKNPSKETLLGARSIPTFQGGKTKIARAITEKVRMFFGGNAKKIDTVIDYFGGSGSWGGYLALNIFKNVKKLVIVEYNKDRLHKIKMFHDQGVSFGDVVKNKHVTAYLDAVKIEIQKKGTYSGSAIANVISKAKHREDLRKSARLSIGVDTFNGLMQAIKDQGMASFGLYGKGKSGDAAVNDIVRRVQKNAKKAYKQVQIMRDRGVEIIYVVGDSYKLSPTQGNNVLAVVDPPYYATKGYNGVGLVPIETYNETRKLLDRLKGSGNSVIYTDEAWWEKHEKTGESVAPPDMSKKVDGLDADGQLRSIQSLTDDFFRMPIAKRMEVVGFIDGNRNAANIGYPESTVDRRVNGIKEAGNSAGTMDSGAGERTIGNMDERNDGGNQGLSAGRELGLKLSVVRAQSKHSTLLHDWQKSDPDRVRQNIVRNIGPIWGKNDLNYELRDIPVESVIPSQEGEDYLNSSSKYTAKQIADAREIGDMHRKDDVLPIILDDKLKIKDGNHRHAASVINKSVTIPALVPVGPGTGKVVNYDQYFSGKTKETDTGTAMFSRGQSTKGLPTQQVTSIVEAIRSQWANAPEVVVAQNMDDSQIPQAVRDYDAKQRSLGATGSPEGFVYGGRVYVVADQLATPTDVIRVMFHESLGHMGLRGVFGKSLEPVLNQIIFGRRAEVLAKAEQYGLDPKNRDDLLEAAEEVLAEMAQSRPELGFVRRAIAAVRNWLRDHVPGFADMKLTDADVIQKFILPARAFVERGRGGADGSASFSRKANQTDTPAFKAWFGDSKVVDANGKPLVVYHGTYRSFSVFDVSAKKQTSLLNDGVFNFSSNPKLANTFARDIKTESKAARYWQEAETDEESDEAELAMQNASNGGNVMPVYINMQHPIIIEKNGEQLKNYSYEDGMDTPDAMAIDDLKLGKYDGVIFRDALDNENVRGDIYVVANPTQIKSAIGNRGTFDPANPDIRYSRENDAQDSYQTLFIDNNENEIVWESPYKNHRVSVNKAGKATKATLFTKQEVKGREYWRKSGELNTFESNQGANGTWLRVQEVSIEKEQRGKGLAKHLYKALLAQSSPNVKGIVSHSPSITNKKQVPSIHAKLGAVTDGDFVFIKKPNNEIRYSRASNALNSVRDGISAATVTDLKHKFANRLSDFRPLALQGLGRRQLVEIYEKLLPQLKAYDKRVSQMDADKNESSAEADELATSWGKLKDEKQLAELMHDSTLAQIDPSKDFRHGDDVNFYEALKAGYDALSPESKATYLKARDMYKAHHAKVREAIRERIERSILSSEKKQRLLGKMDGEFFKKVKGVYFPLSRFGQYLTIVRDENGEVLNVSRSETMNEAEETRRILLREYPASGGFQVGKVLKQREFNAVRDGVGRGFMADLFDTLESSGVGEDVQDAISQLYLASLPDLSWAKHGIHRKGTPGFSQDARRAFAQNMFHGGNYLAKLRHADQLQTGLTDMQEYIDNQQDDEAYESVKAQQVLDEMVKRHDSLMNPQSNPISTALTSFGFVFHLGLSPASAVVNLTQTALVAYPLMGAKWGFDKAGAALLTASKQAATNRNDISKILTGAELDAYKKAVSSGVIDVTQSHDLAGVSQGEDSKLSAKIRPVMKWASFMFHHAERFNRQVTFVASYRLAKQAGQSDDAAFESAVKMTYGGHFDYSASNRARIMQGNVAKVVLLFKQYAQSMIYTLGRNLQQAIQAETPEARKEARKALRGLLVAHALAAGAFGLPVVGTLLALASAIGGDDDEPWDAKVALQNMLADTFGSKSAEVMVHGLSRLTPWDISGRVGLDKLLLPDIQEGLQQADAVKEWMTAALGPVAGVAVNAGKGMQEMADGRYLKGLESMMPVALRNPLKSIRYGTEGNIDKSGIAINDEVGFSGVVGQFLGFSPSETRLAQEGKSAVLSADRKIQDRRSHLMRQYAMAVLEGDEQTKAETKDAIAAFNGKNPHSRINPLQLAQSVRARRLRIDQAKDGIYLPKKRQDAREAGRFALEDS